MLVNNNCFFIVFSLDQDFIFYLNGLNLDSMLAGPRLQAYGGALFSVFLDVAFRSPPTRLKEMPECDTLLTDENLGYLAECLSRELAQTPLRL
ncbi:MAG: hypothetical protein PVF45_09255 [Anaerolineae bacterium]|jgi:hypothetical protein